MTSVADVAGPQLANGDAAQVKQLARRMRTLADDAETIRRRLTPERLRTTWSGNAAEAFAGDVAQVPADLAKVRDSYALAADALGSYADALVIAQQEIRRRVDEINAADGRAHAAGAQESAAAARLRSAQISQLTADPTEQARARRAVERATAERNRARAERTGAEDDRRGAERHAADARERFEQAARRCANALEAASQAGIRNSVHSWWERNRWAFEAGAGAVLDVGKAVVGTVASTATSVAMLFPNLGTGLLTGDWEPLSESLEATANALAVVTLVAGAAVLIVGTGGAAAPVLVAGTAAGFGVSGAKLLLTGARLRAGDKRVTRTDLAKDGVDVVLSRVPLGRTGRREIAASSEWMRWRAGKLGGVQTGNAGGSATKVSVYGAELAHGSSASKTALRQEIRDGAAGPMQKRAVGEIRDEALQLYTHRALDWVDAPPRAQAPGTAPRLTVNDNAVVQHRIQLGAPFVLQPGY